MKKAVVIGACGHIGSYLVPELVRGGYDVAAVSRGNRKPYTADMPEWDKVKSISCDIHNPNEHKSLMEFISDTEPDVIYDITSFTKEDAEKICNPILSKPSFASKVKLIMTGSIWVYDYKIVSPVTEDHPHNAEGNYGRGKTAIEEYLRRLSQKGMINTTILHPGHISGEGWYPINPQGNINTKVYSDIVAGREILLPDDGSATLHHVHAKDIAALVMACIANPDASCGEAFHATSKQALTLRGFAESLYEHFGNKPNIKYEPLQKFLELLSEGDAADSLSHISRSPCCSMEKAEKLLGFVPKHSSIDTVISALEYKIARGELA